MRQTHGRRTRVPRTAVIITGAVIVAAVVVTLLVAWPRDQATSSVATLPRASCGSVITHRLDGDTQLLSAGPGALTCFGTAARVCRPASIAVTEMGVDTGTDYVFTVQPGGAACRLTELSQGYSANFGGEQGRVRSVPCRRTAVARTGVALSCGGQDVLIPARVSGI